MRYCEKCNVSVTGQLLQCPLCQGPLTGEADREGNVFPEIPLTGNPFWLIVRLLLFGTIVVCTVCIAVNVIFPERGWWSLLVGAGLCSGWITVGLAIRKRGKPLKAILWLVCAGSVIIFLWDYCTGLIGWSIDFVLPILYTCTMIAIFVIARLMHRRIQDYLVYLILNILLGLIPLILLLTGAVHTVYPSLVCVVVSVIYLSALILFAGNALKEEWIRRMHL